MAARVGVIDGVVVAVAILVQAVGGLGIQVGSIVGADKSTPFGAVISGIAVVQAGIFVVVVATIADRVSVRYSGIAGNGAVAPYLYFTMICASSQEKATQVKMTWVAVFFTFLTADQTNGIERGISSLILPCSTDRNDNRR